MMYRTYTVRTLWAGNLYLRRQQLPIRISLHPRVFLNIFIDVSAFRAV